jgi:amidase
MIEGPNCSEIMPPNRREFMLAALGALGVTVSCSTAPPAPFRLEEADIESAQRAMQAGSLTARGLCEQYLARIAAMNATLHAVLEVNPDALGIADALDRERRERGPRGPLHGIPVLIKDNIETADRMQTTAGSRALVGVPVGGDAFAVAQLRAAGVVVLGKANLTEWAGGGGVNGYSTRGGQGVNPYDHSRTPLGSSSGPGIAVCANLSMVALGTETMGSIAAPSALLGIVGVRPTVGLVSRTGVVPVASSMDSIGPMTRTVRDAAHLLTALARRDPADAATATAPPPVDYARALRTELDGLRIGVVRERSSSEVKSLFEQSLAVLRTAGAQLVDVELPPIDEKILADQMEVMLAQFKEQLPRYLSSRRPDAPIRTLADIVEANRHNGSAAMPPLVEASLKGPTSGEKYRRAFARLRLNARDKGIDGAAKTHALDAFVGPSLGPAWRFADEAKIEFDEPRGIFLTSGAGYPSVTVPMGRVGDLPVGLLFFGAAWTESTLLRCAFAYEQRTHHRRPPPVG